MNTAFMAILVTIIAGSAIAAQSTINNILSKHVGIWTTNAVVHGTGFLVAVVVTLLLEKNQIFAVGGAPWFSLLGGTLGVGIVASIVFAIGKLNVGLTFAVLVVSQVVAAALIDHFGWFGSTVIPLDYKKALGISFLILGAFLIRR